MPFQCSRSPSVHGDDVVPKNIALLELASLSGDAYAVFWRDRHKQVMRSILPEDSLEGVPGKTSYHTLRLGVTGPSASFGRICSISLS
jgi:hypothetical protein